MISQQLTGQEDLLRDAGFLYGYGCFETLYVQDFTPVFFDQHFQRLSRTATFLGIAVPMAKDALLAACQAFLKQHDLKQARLKWILTAGQVQKRFQCEAPSLILQATSYLRPETLSPRKLTLLQDPYPRSVLDTHKTLNYLKPILHKQVLGPTEDLLFFDKDQRLLEATTSNIWLLKDDCLLTPDHPYVLPGIMREHILTDGYKAYAKKAALAPLTVTDLGENPVLFLSNALMGLVPVGRVIGDF